MNKRTLDQPLRITLTYFLLSITWILFSDRLLVVLIRDTEQFTRWQTYKGTFFVIVVSLLIYFLLKRDQKLQQTTQEALSESQRSFQNLFANNPYPMWVYDLETLKFLAVNEAAVHQYGYSLEEFQQMNITDIHPPEDFPGMLANVSQDRPVYQASGQWRHRTKAGKVFPVEIFSNALTFSDRKAALVAAVDISDRQDALAALKKTESERQELQQTIDRSPVMVFLWQPEESRPVEYVSESVRKLGYTPEELTSGKVRYTEIIDPEDLPRIKVETEANIQKGRDEYIQEYRVFAKDGSKHWIEDHTYIRRGQNGEVLDIRGILQDVTQRKQHEREMEAIAAVSTAIRKAAHLNELVPNVMDQLRSLMSSKNAALAVYDTSTDECLIMCARGYWEDINGLRLASGICPPPRNIHMDELSFTQAFKSRLLSYSQGYRADQPVVGAPLISQGQVIGSIWVGNHPAQKEQTHPYSLEEIGLLRSIADITASAIQREILNEQTAQHAREFSILYQAASEIASRQDPKQLLEVGLNYATQLLNSPHGGIFLYDTNRDDLVLEHALGKTKAVLGLHVALDTGTAGEVVQTLKPVVINHYPTWANRLPEFEDLSLMAAIGVPLLYAGELIGVISIHEYSKRLFSENDVHILSLLANQMAGAIYDARLFSDTVRRLAEMEVLSRVSTDLRLATGRDQIFAVLLDTTLQVLDSEHGAILIKNQSQEEFTAVLTRGAFSPFQGQSIPSTASLAGYAFRSNQVYVTRDLRQDTKRNGRIVSQEVGPAMVVPLRTGETTLGLLFVGRTGAPGGSANHSFKSSEVQLAQTIAEIASSAIHRSTLYEETLHHAEQMTAVSSIGRALAQSLYLPEIYELLTRSIFNLLPDISTVLISRFDPQNQNVVQVYGVQDGQPVDVSQLPPLPLAPQGEGAPSEVIRTRKPLILDKISKKQRQYAAIDAGKQIQSALYVPMLAKGEILGVLQVHSHTRERFHPSDADLLTLVGNTAAITMANASLFKDVQHANDELIQAYDTTLEGWARALELRDQETEGHSKRVAALTLRLAQAAGIQNETLDHIRRGALLHDIGKMGISDNILLKPGPLTREERTIMQKHPVYAYQLLFPIAYLRPALEIPYCHHEKWDGSGYPRGLKGKQIPLAARIFAVIDVWDALRSERPYRPAWSDQAALEYIRAQATIHFDPDLVELFLRLVEKDPAFST